VSRWHPVALFGRAAGFLLGRAPSGDDRELIYGAGLALGLPTLVFVGAMVLVAAAERLHPLITVGLTAVLLKPSFSLRQLVGEAGEVARCLEEEGVAAARRPLSALVSRDLTSVPPHLAASAAIESLAENLSDSFVAPLFYYALLGVPGALTYRAINTLDAMIGYHGRFEYLGRVAARLDDLVNLIPARLSAAMLVVAAALARADWRGALSTARRDHGRTESPNAGWPMAAMAGALRAELMKEGHYQLGDPSRTASPAMIREAVGIVWWASALTCVLVFGVLLWPRRG
jgi:adenosylcobinamide-phosphate synthase